MNKILYNILTVPSRLLEYAEQRCYERQTWIEHVRWRDGGGLEGSLLDLSCLALGILAHPLGGKRIRPVEDDSWDW